MTPNVSDQPLTMSNTSEAVAEVIRTAILEGRLSPGTRLKEHELAVQIGTSRTPVREALQRLQTDGLVEIIPKRGATVKAHDQTQLADLYSVRALLEGYAAEQAADRATEEQIALLQESCERFRHYIDSQDVRALQRENLVFHYAVADSASTIKIAEFIRSSVEVPLVYRTYAMYSRQDLLRSLGSHQEITAMVATRNGQRAALVMKNHILEGRDRLVKYMHDVAKGESPELAGID